MPAAGPETGPILDELEKVLASPGFVRNERLSKFLRFLVEQQLGATAGQLKETVIAVEVFGRRPDYDPKEDSIVRTEAARLRTRLSEYFAGEGGHDAVIIELPKGGYAPVFRSIKPQLWTKRRWVVAISAAVTVVLLGFVVFRLSHAVSGPKTIAVLPLENRSPEPGSEYFSDGLTDEIIQNLSAIEGLEVRSRTSSAALKGKPRNMREVGQQLRVSYVLEGSVARAGDMLRVSVQLVRAGNDTPLWSGRWDRELRDVFVIQDEISRAIVNELRLKLGSGQRRYNTNVEAYDLYLKARHLLDRQEFDDARKSIDVFEHVIAKDSGFAPAYAGLAKAYGVLSYTPAEMPASEANPKIATYSEKALRLDPLLPDAWTFRGLALDRDYAWTEAEKAYRRAIELNPSLADAHTYYGDVLFRTGREDEGRREMRKAVELEPLVPGPLAQLTFLLVSTGRTNEAWEALSRLHTMDPNSMYYQYDGRLLLQTRRITEAIPYFPNEEPGSRGFLGLVYGLLGRRAQAEELRKSEQHPNHLALICAGLGDKDCVIEALNRMADMKDQRIHYYLRYPELSLIRGDPRLASLKKKIGL